MPNIAITVPTEAVAAVSHAYGDLTGLALLTAVQADLAAYLKEKVRGFYEREAREAAAKTVTAPNIS